MSDENENAEAAEMNEEPAQKNSRFTPTIVILTAMLLGASTLSVMSFKTQERLGFKYSMFQTFMMFIGEYINILIFGALMASDERRFNHFLVLTHEAKENNQTLHFTKLWMAITSLLDTIGSTLHLTALMLLPPSL